MPSIPKGFRVEYQTAVHQKEAADRRVSQLFRQLADMRNGDPRRQEVEIEYAAAEERAARAYRALTGVVDKIRDAQGTRTEMPRRTRPPRPKPEVRPRNLDVPLEYLRFKDGPFLPGHDAKYKSDLVKSALGESTKFDRREAEERLRQRGWLVFLDKAKRRKGGSDA